MVIKRFQLFGIYSLSLFSIIGIFSLAIYFSVSFSEEDRIANNLKNNINHMLQVDGVQVKTLDEIQTYAQENRIDYAIWFRGEQQPYKKTGLTLTWPSPTQYEKLEKIWAQRKYTGQEYSTPELVYSYAIPVWLNGKAAEIQIISSTKESNAMLTNLTSVLFFGSTVVSVLGIGLGIMLAFLNMMPIIRSWNQQRTFVADASHELRTPLSIITLKSDHLMTHSDDTVYDHIEEVAVIQQECRRMHKMVDDLLFLAKSDSGVVDIDMKDFSVEQLGHELKLLYDEFFEIEEKEFIVDLKYNGLVVGDYEKIKQVCMIIIDNGLRFTTEGNYIKLAVRARANRIYFDITNNGVPLKNEEIPFIFNRFYKSDASRNKSGNKEGNGLGLSIAQEIIHNHQSKIRAYVNNECTGFSFSLAKGKEKKSTQNTDTIPRIEEEQK